jgi:AcrR family transcriptional regulator
MDPTPTRKELTHQRIVEVASRAIRRAGYQGVGVADIMKEAGLTHGGFYAHFASRDALLVEAIEQAGRDNAAVLQARRAQREAEGLSPLQALLGAYLHADQLSSADRGCIVAALASETPRQDDAVREAARQRAEALVGQVRGALPPAVPAGEAAVVTATMVGALQLARTFGGAAGAALLAHTRDTLIERYDPLRAPAPAPAPRKASRRKA